MKETEIQNTSETSKAEVQNLSAQDKARKHRKTAKAAISFIVMILLLVAFILCRSEHRKPEGQLPGTAERFVYRIQ